jgi:hypothetical protein
LRDSQEALVIGTFSDLKIVKSRSVVQVVIEVPLEQGEKVIQAFGMPQPGSEVPVVVARLKTQPEAPSKGANPDRSAAAKDRFRSLPPPEKDRAKCGVLCASSGFQRWIGAKDEEEATKIVRSLIGGSRSLISEDEAVHAKWIELLTEYELATGQLAEPR